MLARAGILKIGLLQYLKAIYSFDEFVAICIDYL